MSEMLNLTIPIDAQVKIDAEELFASFGITVTDAINIFLHQSVMNWGFPFEIKQPRFNAETEAAMQEARDIMSGKIKTKSYASAKELSDELDAEMAAEDAAAASETAGETETAEMLAV